MNRIEKLRVKRKKERKLTNTKIKKKEEKKINDIISWRNAGLWKDAALRPKAGQWKPTQTES